MEIKRIDIYGSAGSLGGKAEATVTATLVIGDCDRVEKAKALIGASADMQAALEFYANPENYKEVETGIGMYPGEVDQDGGSRARAALAKSKGEA